MTTKNKTLSRLTAGTAALLLYSALGLPAQAQTTVEVGGAGTIGDTTLTASGSIAVVPNNGELWSTDGGTGAPGSSGLISPAVTVANTGNVTLTFTHRYDFEVGYDGGAVFVSVNAGPFTYVPLASFSSNGYTGTTSGSTAWAGGEDVFIGESAGFGTPSLITSVADLGSLNATDTVSVEFRGEWDEGVVEGPPAWEIGTVQLTDPGATLLDADFNADGPSGFTVVNTGFSGSPWNYLNTISRFEVNGDTEAADRYVPDPANSTIDLNYADIVVDLLTGTLDGGEVFSLFDLSGGATLSGSVNSITFVPLGVWDSSNLATAGTVTYVSAPTTLTWDNTSTDGLWNTTSANWTGDSTLFTDDGSNVVIFGDAGGGGEIIIDPNMSPAQIQVDSALDYRFSTGVLPQGVADSIDSGALIKDGTGTLYLGDDGLGQQFGGSPNIYSNGFTSVQVNAGRLVHGGINALGTGTVTFEDGTSWVQAEVEGRINVNNENIPNPVHVNGIVNIPLAFGDDNKGIWITETVSGPGGFNVTGSHRSLGLSGDNTFSGGLTINEGGSALQVAIGSYTGLGTGTLTANGAIVPNNAARGGFEIATNLPGDVGNPNGITNPVVINAGKFLNIHCKNAGHTALLSGVISGDGTLHKWKNDSTVVLSGTNTYTGGTIIDAGTLKMDVQADSALGTGPVTLNDGTLFLERINATNDLVVNGGKVFGSNGFGNSWSGTVTLNADLTIESTTFGGPTRFDGIISGTGGLILTGLHGVELTAANDYTGDTTVNSGTLKVNGSSIADTNKLVINGGKVEPVGTEDVDTLFFGGTQQDAGTYGSTSSTATNQDDTRFSGTGVVNVLTGLGIDQADILSFGLPGWPSVITGTAIAWTVPVGTDVTTLAPTFEISFGATATPVSGTSRDFTTPQTYSIESGDTTVTQVYTVTVTLGAVPSIFDWAAAVDGDWSEATNWTDDLALGFGPGTTGAPFYTLNFTQAGTYIATHDLSDPFQLNQLNFAGQVTLDGLNGLELAADDATLPTINQNSGSAVNVNLPLTLAADTTLGGSSGGEVRLNKAIGGTGSLTMDGPGTFRLKDPDNTSSYSGGTFIESGTLRLDYAGADYPTSNVLGTGPVTLNGGTLYLWRVYPLNALIANGGSIFSGNGFGNNWEGPITLNVDTTVNCQFILRANGDIDGSGGLIKTGNDRLWLNGTNTYTGDTTVNAGTLRTTGSSIIDAGKVVIDGGKVEPIGTETVGSLFFGAAQQADGTWGATGSGATNIDDARFTGTAGMLMVGAVSNPYDDWAAAAGLDGTAGKENGKTDDPDGDGKDNNHEFAFNGDPLDPSDNGQIAGLVQDTGGAATEELTLVVAVRRDATFASAGSPVVQTATQDGVIYTIEGSVDLSTIPGSDVSEPGAASDTAPAATGLPSLAGTDWEYHTFKLDASEGLADKGFLRAKAEVE